MYVLSLIQLSTLHQTFTSILSSPTQPDLLCTVYVARLAHHWPLADPQIDIQTLPWPEIVKLIGEIRKHNPMTSLSNNPNLGDMVGEDVDVNIKKLDAHDVAKYVTLRFLLSSKPPSLCSHIPLCLRPGTLRRIFPSEGL